MHTRHRVTFERDRFATLDEIALELGVTRQRVRQIETAALRKVSIALRRRGIDATLAHALLADLGRALPPHEWGAATEKTRDNKTPTPEETKHESV